MLHVSNNVLLIIFDRRFLFSLLDSRQFRSVNSFHSFFIMASTIILFTSLAIASMLGRTSSKIFLQTANERYSRHAARLRTLDSTNNLLITSTFFDRCDSGRFVSILNPISEVAGILIFAPLWLLSKSSESPNPIDCTNMLFLCACIAFILYASSFALHFGATGELILHQQSGSRDSILRKCLLFGSEVIITSTGDITKLLEEVKLSFGPLLPNERIRVPSESSLESLLGQAEKGEIS
jgi:hypothetical protein